MLPYNFSLSRLHWTSALAPLATCAYIAGFAAPFEWDIPLVVLALVGGLAIVFGRRHSSTVSSPLIFPVIVFLIATGLSILASEDISRSLRLSAPLVPAVLLFFLIADQFHSLQHTRLLFLTFCAVGLGLPSAVLWTVWMNGWAIPERMSNVGSPVLIVPNDCIFLAAVAPLSLVLLFDERRSAVKVLAVLSILLSVCAVIILRSRGALLTIIASTTIVTALVRPRLALVSSSVILVLALLVDGLVGFPLLAKFGHISNEGPTAIGGIAGRGVIWSDAWKMFLQAPILGHGARTFISSDQTPWVHNLYLEVLAEQGIVGLAALMFLLASGLSAAWKIQRTTPSETRILGVGPFAGLIAFCFAALFESSFLRQWVVITLFVLLGVVAQLASVKQNLRFHEET